ncbi:MAG: YadA-like family protein [Leptotrichia sp.]|nr:YadA-like family protein [Leptotrichia sp.]
MSRKKKEERKTQKGKFKNKLCFLAAAIAAGTITTEDKKLYGGEVCTVRVNGVTTGNPTTLGSAPGTDAIACGDGAIANGMSAIATGKGSFTGYNKAVAIGENATAVRDSDVAIGTGAGLYNQGLNAKRLPNGNLNTSATRGYNVIIGANAMVGDDNNTSVHTSQGIAIGGSGTQRDIPTRKYGDSGGAWAKGDQSIAIGGDTIADGHSSIAIGGDDLDKAGSKTVTYTLGTGTKTASLDTAMTDLTGASTGYHQYNATRSGAGAVALGVKAVSNDLSLAIGTKSTASKINTTAIGTAAVADLDNSVAIGGGSTTANAAGTQETSATINGVTYSNFAGGSGTKVGDVVSLGKNGTFNRQIKNVAAGNISATSTDAINGSQLYSVAQTLQDRFKYVSINSTETGNADNKGALATNSIAIGPNASTTVKAENAVVIGNGAKTTEQVMNPGAPTQWTKTGKNSVVIGNKAATNSEGSVAIGHEAKVDNTTGNSGSTIGRYKNDDNSTYMGTSLAQNNIYADPSYVGTQGIAIGANSYSDYQGMSMGVGARSKNLSLALGYFSNAEGTSSIATGVGAYAKGDNSISSGRQSSTISTGSVALGVAARGGSTADGGLGGSIAVGAASDATHEQAIAIGGITNANTATLEQGRGDNTQATAARATAIGANAKAQAESSIAFGTKANVGSAGTNAVAIGKDSSATIANGVALGSESKATTAAGVTGFDMADGRSNVYSGLAGTAKTANMAAVSVGDGANKTRQITGVAAGKEDTDAVNVAQLKSTNLKIAGNTTSGGADVRLHDQTLTVKGDGTYLTSTAAGNTITMELKQDVKDKIDNAATKKLDNLDPAGVQKIKDTAAWNVVANSGTAEKVQGGDTVKFINGDNIEVTQSGKDFTFATKKDVTFDSVTINNGPKLSSTGIDAGNKKISNLADGTANNDAVNLGQLNNAINNATTTATSTEKVVASTAADNIATVAPSTGQNLGDKNATYEVSVSKTAVQNIAKDAAAWNVSTNGGTAEKVEGGDTVNFVNGDNIEVTNTGKDITIATKRDVNFDSVTVPAGAGNVVINNSGINAGGNKITNVADGTIAPGSKDAVNGGQLHDVQNTINAGAFTVSANGGAKDRIAKDENIDFENTDGNIAISYDATGNKFTYNLSPNLNLGPAGSLRIGDALLNNGGLTIVNGPSITSAGVDAGNKKVTNVADGTIAAGSKDAINGGQLHDVQTNLQTSINNNAQNIANNTNAINNLNAAVNNPITFTGDSGNNIDRKLGETLNIKGGATGNLTSGNIGVEADSTTNTLNVKLAENIDLGTNGSVKMGDTKIDDNGLTINGGPSVTKAGIDAGNKKVTNVANGDITATSKDAVNGSQLHGVADSIKNSIGGNTILNPDGTITTSNIGGTGQNNIHDAISAVNSAANQKTTVVAGDNIDVTVSTNATGGNEYTVATKRDIVVDSVSVANNGPSMNSNGINAGGKTISNLGAGVNPDDAVNVAQLDAVKNSPITFGADTGTDYAATLGSKVNIVGDNKNITTSVNGNNIQVAMSDTPSFGTVNVNVANTGTITGASNVTLDNLDEDGTVGRVATEAQLAAVRNEVTAGTKDIDNKLRGFKRGADAGTASAMAMAGIPQVINPGENAIGASISAYKQQTAVAVGYTRASKNGRAVLKISGSVNSNSELGFSLGFMKGWD